MDAAANSHKTAITRKGPSAPCRWLVKQGRVVNPSIDWGCGKGADVAHIDGVGYDPYYQPYKPTMGEMFNTVLCTYVLNTMPNYHDRCLIVERMATHLNVGGWLYVTIRADKKKLNGWTQRGTWQGYVGDQLKVGGFEILRYNQGYEIWGWQKT